MKKIQKLIDYEIDSLVHDFAALALPSYALRSYGLAEVSIFQ